MYLMDYIPYDNCIAYRCELCNAEHTIDGYDIRKFEIVSKNICVLNVGEELICSQCLNVHKSNVPLKYSHSRKMQCVNCGSDKIELTTNSRKVCLNCRHKF